jgi:hypothetical protein
MYASRALAIRFEGELLGLMSHEKLEAIAGARWERYVKRCIDTGFEPDAAMIELRDAAALVIRYRFWRE